jgi:hypothetical protein
MSSFGTENRSLENFNSKASPSTTRHAVLGEISAVAYLMNNIS